MLQADRGVVYYPVGLGGYISGLYEWPDDRNAVGLIDAMQGEGALVNPGAVSQLSEAEKQQVAGQLSDFADALPSTSATVAPETTWTRS